MEKETFADYIADIRIKREFSLRRMADLLNISAAYYSDVEKGRRNPLRLEKLELFARVADMTAEEKNRMLDLAGNARGTVAPDIAAYVRDRPYVAAALRLARDRQAGRREWDSFTSLLKGE